MAAITSSSTSSSGPSSTTEPTEGTARYPKILINIIKSLERLIPQVREDGLMYVDSSTGLWDDSFWTDAELTPRGKGSYKSHANHGQRELRPHVLPKLKLGWNRHGVHTIDSFQWFERLFLILKRRGKITDQEKLVLRDLAELNGDEIIVFKPQAFSREEMRMYTNCKVFPNSSARSAVQIPCPNGHLCQFVKEVPGGGSQHVNNPLLIFGESNRSFFIAHQYECSECLRQLDQKTAPAGTGKLFFGHQQLVARNLPATCKPAIELVDDHRVEIVSGEGKKRVDSRISSSLMRMMFGKQPVSAIQASVEERYFQNHVDNERTYRKMILELRSSGKIAGAETVFPAWREEPRFKAPSLEVLEQKFQRRFHLLEPALDRQIASVEVNEILTLDVTFQVVAGVYGKGKGACITGCNHIGQIAVYGFCDSENWADIMVLLFQLYERMTPAQRLQLKYVWTDTCCRGAADPYLHPIVSLFQNVVQVYMDNMHAQGRLTADVNKNHSDYAEFLKDKRSWFWQAIPSVIPDDPRNDTLMTAEIRRLDLWLKTRNYKPIKEAARRMAEIQNNTYYWAFLPLVQHKNNEIVRRLRAGKMKWLARAELQSSEDVQAPTLLKKAFYRVNATGIVVDKDDASGVGWRVAYVVAAFDRLIAHGLKHCLSPELSVLEFNHKVGDRSPITGLQRYHRPHSSSHNEAKHAVLNKLTVGISHQRPEKRDRRVKLRIVHLNHDISVKNGSNALHPIDVLFDSSRELWSLLYEARPFNRTLKPLDFPEELMPFFGHKFATFVKSRNAEQYVQKILERKQQLASDAMRLTAADHSSSSNSANLVQSTIATSSSSSSSSSTSASSSSSPSSTSASSSSSSSSTSASSIRPSVQQSHRQNSARVVTGVLSRVEDFIHDLACQDLLGQVIAVHANDLARTDDMAAMFNLMALTKSINVMTNGGFIRDYLTKPGNIFKSMPVAPPVKSLKSLKRKAKTKIEVCTIKKIKKMSRRACHRAVNFINKNFNKGFSANKNNLAAAQGELRRAMTAIKVKTLTIIT